jgi:hypothetical protein
VTSVPYGPESHNANPNWETLCATTMSLSSMLHDAASHRTGGIRSFPASSDQPVWLKYAYDAPDQAYAKFWFRHVNGHRGLQSAAATTPAAGWVMPGNDDCHPVLVAHSILAAIWLLREMLPAALADDSWQQLVAAAQSLSGHAATPSPPPSTQPPATVQMEDTVSDLDTASGAEPDSESDADPVQSHKRKAHAASLELAPKRVCTPSLTSPAPSSDDKPQCIVTVTNNNRRSHLRIQNKITKVQERRKLDLGLLPPAKDASAAEKHAYQAIVPADVQHVSWLLKQPAGDDTNLYHKADSPYKTATDMLSKARAVGHQDAWSNAASFLSSWRQHGTPFCSQEPAALSQRQARTRRDNTATDLASFQYVWRTCDYYDSQLTSAIIKYRWAMALLGRAYASKIAQAQDSDGTASSNTSRNRRGKGKARTEAVDSLLRAVSSANPSHQERDGFRRRLSRATRWYTAATTLGWGSLCLMPSDDISNTWVEKKLTSVEWKVWLDLVRRIQPDAYTASRKLDAWLGVEGIEGGSLQDKETLCIEAGPPAVVCEVEEVADSDSEGDSAVHSNDRIPLSTSPSTYFAGTVCAKGVV